MQVQSKSRLNRKTVALLLAAAVSAGISSAVYGQTTYSGPAFEGAQIETGSAYVSSSGAFFTLEGAGYQYANFGILDFSPAALGIPAGNNVTSISSLNVQLTQEDYFNPPTTSPGATLTFYLASDTNAAEVANGSTSLSYENPSTYTGGLNAPGQTGSFVAGSSLIELGTSTYTNGAPNGTVDLVNLPVTSAVNSALLAQFNTGQPIRIVVTTSETSSDGDAFYGYNYATNPAYDPKISLGLNTSSVASNGSLLYANTIGSKSASVTVGTYLTDHGAGQYCVLQGATSNEVITTNPNGTQNIAPSTVTLVNGSSAPGDTLSYVVQSTNNATGTITTPGPNPMAPGGTAQATVGFGPADSTTEAGNQISGSATFSNSSNYKNDTTGVTVNINPALVLQERFVDSFGGSSNNPTLAPNAHKVLVGATGTVAASITTDNPVNITDYSNDALTTETLLPNQTSTPAKVTDFFTFATVATITASSPSYSQTFDNTQVGTVTGMVVPIISGQYGNDVPVTEGTLTQKYTPTYTAFPQAAITGDGLQGEKDSSEIFVQWTGYQAAAVTSASGSPIGPSPSTPAVLSNAPSDDNNYVDTNGTTHINGLRATAWVTGIAFNQDGWSQTGFTPSSNGSGTTVAVAAGSSTAGTASATLAFNSTNKLNGTYSGTMAVALENEQDIQGTSVNDVAPVTFNLQTIVTSQPAIESGSYTLIGGKFVAAATNLTGTLALTSGLASFPSGLAISGSGKVVLATNATLGSQSTPPASSVNITSLSITGNGTLDINNNHIIISYAVGQDPIASIAALIKSGFNGGAWNGAGIMSTAAAANSGSYGIGYADANDPGNPAGLASGQIEVMYTLLGDANLDGAVNGSDFAILATNFNKAVSGWDQGDFNYDGAANGSDFASLASNFNKGASQSADASLVSFASTNGLLADVPEPASMGLLAVSGLSLLARRKRRVNG